MAGVTGTETHAPGVQLMRPTCSSSLLDHSGACVCVDCIQYGTLSCDKQFNHTPRLLLLVCLHSGLGQREIQVIYYLWIDMVEASHAASKLRGELQGS